MHYSLKKVALATLLAISSVALMPGVSYAGAADTKITHKAADTVRAGQRITLEASVSDPDGIKEVRAYFKSELAQDFSFVKMAATGGDKFAGVLPAPSKGSKSIDYLILARDGIGQIVKSQTFRLSIEPGDDKLAAASGKVQVYTELAKAPQEITGFTDSIVLDVVESAAKFGVVAGIVSEAGAGTSVAAVSGAGSTAATVTTTVATAGGISTGAIALGAVAIGAAAGGGSSGSSSATPTPTPTPTPTTVSIVGSWTIVGSTPRCSTQPNGQVVFSYSGNTLNINISGSDWYGGPTDSCTLISGSDSGSTTAYGPNINTQQLVNIFNNYLINSGLSSQYNATVTLNSSTRFTVSGTWAGSPASYVFTKN